MIVEQYLYKTASNSCQMTFANLYCLRDKYGTEICVDNDVLYIRQKKRIMNEAIAYFVPMCGTSITNDDSYLIDSIKLILETSRKERHKPYFFAVTDETLEKLESLIDYNFNINEQEDWAEYIYKSDKLVDFSSSELSKQRRAVNRFWNLYGEETSVEQISENNIERVMKYQNKWFNENLNKNMDQESLREENTAIVNALDNFNSLKLEGVTILVGKAIRAYAYGTILPGGAFDIIAQKGDIGYQQIYKVVLQEHVKTYFERAKLTNMEEDIGLIGLRRSKSRYKPEFMLKKYTAEFK